MKKWGWNWRKGLGIEHRGEIEKYLIDLVLPRFFEGQVLDAKLMDKIEYLGPDFWKLRFDVGKGKYILYGWDYLSEDDDTELRLKEIVSLGDKDITNNEIVGFLKIYSKDSFIYMGDGGGLGKKYRPVFSDRLVVAEVKK